MATDQASEQPDSDVPSRRVAAVVSRLRNLPAWLRQHRAASAAVAAAVVALLGVGGWFTIAVATASDQQEQITVQTALDDLDQGKFSEARDAALQLLEGEPLAPRDFGGPHFVLGMVNALEAGGSWDNDAKRLHLLAAAYLEESRDRGFPEGRESQGLFHLGRSLFLIGRYAQARANLVEALDYDPPQRAEIHRLLTEAHLKDPNPDYEAALAHNRDYVTSTDLPPSDRFRAILTSSRILLRLDRVDEVRQLLEQIPEDSDLRAEALVLKAQTIMREAGIRFSAPEASVALDDPSPTAAPDGADPAANSTRYAEAIDVLRQAQAVDTLKTQSTPKSMYLIGVCQRAMGNNQAALEQFKRTNALHRETDPGIPATIELGELLAKSGRFDEATEAYRDAIALAGDPETYRNPWLTLDELRSELLDGYQSFVDAGEYAHALGITSKLSPLFEHERQTELTARCHVAWGVHLMDQAATAPWSKAIELRSQARQQFRLAGNRYRDLSKLHVTLARYSDDVWRSAENFLAGHDFDNAVRALDEYLSNETRRRRPRALVSLAEARLSQGKPEQAIDAVKELLELYPEDVASFDARRIGSLAYRELEKFDDAESLLLENLNGSLLTPRSREWKEALFAHGRLLFDTGRFQEAARQLEVAVKRYPVDPEALEARYLLGEALRQLADEAQKLEEREFGLSANQVAPNARKLLGEALGHYRQLRTELVDREAAMELTPVQSTLLRNCHLALADVQFDLQDYEQAIEAYSTAANRYQLSPVSLIAYEGIYNCFRRLGRNDDARGIVEQAKAVLQRIDKDVPFESETNYSKQQWQDLLDWLASL